MTWSYHFAPYVWPMLASAAFMVALVVYGWPRRDTPGGLPYVLMLIGGVGWALGSALSAAAIDATPKYFWFRVEAISASFAIMCVLWFALEFAGLDRWITRRNVILVSIAPAAIAILYAVGQERLYLARAWQDGVAYDIRGAFYLPGAAYFLAIALLNSLIMLWVFIRYTGIYRWQAGLILIGGLFPRVLSLLKIVNVLPPTRVDWVIVSFCVAGVSYAIALFQFQFLAIGPALRRVLENSMREGMLVLDNRGCVVEMNPAAERLLHLDPRAAVNRPAAEALNAFPELVGLLSQPTAVQAEVSIGEGAARSCCEASVSAIVHPRGWSLGRVVLLYDVTGRKRAEAQILDHQRALATAAEREHLGRELHDGFGQVLGYAKLQIAAARARLSQGDLATADGYLANLEHVVQDAHTDVREFLLAIRTGIGPDRAFTVALREYLREYSRSYGIETAVETASDLELAGLGPAAEVQVLRVIQEALTNARKHAKAALVRVSLEARDHVIVAAICDDGLGFDATAVENDGYGLRFMRDRAAAIGGDLQIHSAPGEGTVVILTVPNRKETP